MSAAKLRCLMLVCASMVARSACAVRFYSDLNFYMDDEQAYVLAIPQDSSGRVEYVEVSWNGEVIAQGEPVKLGSYAALPFDPRIFPEGDSQLVGKAIIDGEETADAGFRVTRLQPRPNAVQIDRVTGGLRCSGLPCLPVGFYSYWPVQPTLAEEEVSRGFTLFSPYQDNRPQTLEQRREYLDRCAELGMRVHYHLIDVAGGGGVYDRPSAGFDEDVLRSEIKAFRDHPALLGWYISDEPTGRGFPPERLTRIREIIRELDPYHPVSIVFMRPERAVEYRDAMDIVMVDPYPIPNYPPSRAGQAVATVFNDLAPELAVWMVPQCFGGNEHWQREPTPGELRVMTFLGIIEGARGIQYFVRHGHKGFPKSPLLWSAASECALLLAQLTPPLLSREPPPEVVSSQAGVRARAYRDRGRICCIVVNTANYPLEVELSFPELDAYPGVAEVLFMNRSVPLVKAAPESLRGLRLRLPWRRRDLQPRGVRLNDILDAHSVRIYCFGERTEATDEDAPLHPWNQIINPSFEHNLSPGTPMGSYARVGSGRGGTYWTDPRIAYHGRKSLRIRGVTSGENLLISPFSPHVEPGKPYRFQIWAKPDNGAANPVCILLRARSSAAREVELVNGWQQVHIDLKPTGSRQALDVGVVGKGMAWIDAMEFFSLSPVIKTRAAGASGVEIVMMPPLPEVRLHYRLDGEEATMDDPIYHEPISLQRSSDVSVLTVEGESLLAHARQRLLYHEALGVVPQLTQPWAERYPGRGDIALTNGVLASADLKDPEWQGYLGGDFEAVLDLGEEVAVRHVAVRFLQDQRSWIFLPLSVNISFSTDGDAFNEAAQIPNPYPENHPGAFVHEFKTDLSGRARYVRVHATAHGKCPDWHPGAGRAAWLFIDEIMINPDGAAER